jgi:hypothetical protein
VHAELIRLSKAVAKQQVAVRIRVCRNLCVEKRNMSQSCDNDLYRIGIGRTVDRYHLLILTCAVLYNQ